MGRTTSSESFLVVRIVHMIGLIVGCLAIHPVTFSMAAELFPFDPPATSRERKVEQHRAFRPQLSAEDRNRISSFANEAKRLPDADQKQLKQNLRNRLDKALLQGNWNQAKYFNELLRQID